MKTSTTSRLIGVSALALLAGCLTHSASATMLIRYTFDEASSGTTTALNGGTLGGAADGLFSGQATRTNSGPAPQSIGTLALRPNGGNDDIVNTGADVDGLDALTSLTITTWINVQSNRNLPYYGLANDSNAGAQSGFTLNYYPDANTNGFNMKLSLTTAGTYTVQEAIATSFVNASNTWVFIAATWDGSTARFYAGSPGTAPSLISSGSLTQPMTANTSQLRVGGNPSGASDRTPDALMDDFRIYNTALSLSELTVTWGEIPEPSTFLLLSLGGLVVWWRRK